MTRVTIRTAVCCGWLAIASARPTLAATINVPNDWPTIQAAVAAAGPGDTIQVEPGDYVVPVRIEGDRDGLTIEAANPSTPPVLHGVPHVKHDGFRVDDVDGVTIRNFVVLDAYDGVRLNRVHDGLVVGLRIERTALGVRVNRGTNNRVIGCTIIEANVEQGILLDNSPGGVVWDNTVVDSDGDGVRLVSSPCSDLRNLVVLDSYGDGIEVHSSPGTHIETSTMDGNRNNGLRVSSSPFLGLVGNTATNNGNNGLWIYRSPPFRSVEDVTAEGNQADGNGRHDIVVTPRKSPVDNPPCGPTPTTTTTSAGPTTSTTSTSSTTIRPTTSSTKATTSTTSATTSTTTLPEAPVVLAHWRFYVRVSRTVGSETNVDVPKRSIDAPVDVAIREDHLAAFRVGDQMTRSEIQALGGDTLARLTAAAGLYLGSHEADYPLLEGIVELRWAAREP